MRTLLTIILILWVAPALGILGWLTLQWHDIRTDPFQELRDQAEQFRRIALASELQTAAMRIRVDLLKGDQP